MDLMLFDEVAETMRALVPVELGPVRVRVRRYGIKVWFGTEQPPREHYEAQVIGARHVDGATVLAVEIGFHCENRDKAANDQVIAHLLAAEPTWRPVLGDEAVAGPFLGRPDDWRRLSETWADPDLGDPDLGMEMGTRLTDYLTALEPVRRRER
jgi:hypothetical protein